MCLCTAVELLVASGADPQQIWRPGDIDVKGQLVLSLQSVSHLHLEDRHWKRFGQTWELSASILAVLANQVQAAQQLHKQSAACHPLQCIHKFGSPVGLLYCLLQLEDMDNPCLFPMLKWAGSLPLNRNSPADGPLACIQFQLLQCQWHAARFMFRAFEVLVSTLMASSLTYIMRNVFQFSLGSKYDSMTMFSKILLTLKRVHKGQCPDGPSWETLLNLPLASGSTPLATAAWLSTPYLMAALLEAGADPAGLTTLAVKRQSVNVPHPIQPDGMFKFTPLMISASKGDLASMIILLSRGPRCLPKEQLGAGRSPLVIALNSSQCEDPQLWRQLFQKCLSAKISITQPSHEPPHQTPLIQACHQQQAAAAIELIKLLASMPLSQPMLDEVSVLIVL